MIRIKLVGLALAAVCAIGAISVDSAGASTFLLLGATTAKVLAKALAAQTFVTKAGTIQCTALTGLGAVTAKHALTLEATVTYSGCKAFGLAITFSPALFEFSADGSVKLLTTVTGKATGCVITIPGGQTLSTAKYTNKAAGEIEIVPNIAGITSSGTGAACEYASESKGTYTGASLAAVDGGGTIEWAA